MVGAGLILKTRNDDFDQSGMRTTQNFRGILERDKDLGIGGHAIKNRSLLRQKIDRDNEKILNSLRE